MHAVKVSGILVRLVLWLLVGLLSVAHNLSCAAASVLLLLGCTG
jgi:hypothetical protein